ncbi:small acid-soluble spore protein Tlp [Sporolactobacillus laevolacticus]|jgi:small acid-soluble spore protein (thioredoxin-like protein)|uniref:Spore protein n=1 Tax=Sporolactobacillus laevolacticus DSM 442 TaxID=1395513 RepID=V6IUY2_9BACL|nr:small acid-soluble spore protein Tlp [Sporolactobacillus laevolacticus]EST10870.1 spore protein [Sporolactobacillus laevolacticus DSM 442]MDF2911311.1 tlp [Sporolactobacillus laevolacticus]
MAKPDDRSDNMEKIAKNIGHTLKNMDEANDFVKAHGNEMSEEEKQQIQEKNQRREQSIEGLRDEIKDEAAFSKTR